MSDQEQLTVIKFTADGSGVESGLTSIKRSISDLGTAVKGITDKTNDALSKVGTKDLPVSDGLVRASKTIIKQTGDIEKAIATFGSTASTSLKAAYKDINSEEVRLRGLGINPDIMNPYLEKLREVQKITAAVSAQERLVSQEAAKLAAEENRRLEHTLELKRQLANVKTTVESNAAAKQAEAVAQQQFKLLALNNKIAASNKAASDAQAAAAAKTLKDLKDLTAAQAAYKAEVMNSQLNFTYTGRGKSTEFLADKGQRLGFDPSFIAAELAGYKKVEDAAKAAFQAANPHIAELSKRAEAAGTSVKGLSASLRNVPAQFTDIIVSLQGGQAPLTVLLQQGGQLKDMFGGTGNAARALGGYVLGLINPFTIAAAAVGTLALAYLKGAAEGEAYNKALIMTGNYAGTTSAQLTNMAQAISQTTGGTVSSAAQAIAALANTGSIGSQQFEKLGASITQWSKATGLSVEDIAKQFSKLGEDPLKASVALNESQHYLTRTIYDQIKALTDQGRMLEAGVVAQTAWSDAITDRAPKLLENLGYVEKAWRSIGGAARWAWDGMLDIGRPVDDAAVIRKSIAAEEAFLRSKFGKVPDDDAGLNSLRQKLAIQERGVGYEALSAKYQAEEAKATEAKVAWDKEHDKFLSKQVQMQREITAAQNKYNALKPEDRNPSQYAETIVGIQKKFAETEKKAKAESDAFNSIGDAIARAAAASDDYLDTRQKASASAKFEREQLDAIDKALRQKNISLNQAVELESKLHDATLLAIEVENRQGASKASKDAIKFMQDENKAYEEHARVLRTSEKAIADYADSAKLAAEDLTFETTLIGLNTAERERSIEQRKIQLELDKELRRINDAAGLKFEEKESQKAIAMQASLSKASTAAARSSLNEWAKTSDSIRDSLVDAFDSAILTGKDLFTSLRDMAVKLFDGLVLRPILQGVLQPVATALTGSLIGTAANAATGASATSGLLSSVTGIGASAGAGSISSLLGSSGMGALDIMGFDPTTIGIALGVAFLSSLGGKFVSATDSGRASIDYTAAGIGGAAYNTTGDAAQIAVATANTTALAKTYFDTASALGVKAMQAAFEVGTNTGREGAAPQTVLGVSIGKASYSSGEIASTDAAGLSLAASRAVLTALQASELPSYLSGVFDDITASNATQEQITAALTGAAALKTFHDQLLALPFQRVADLSYEATQGLIAASGGLDKLASNLGTYYSNFYTAEEQRLQTIANINKATAGSGLDAANATRESFRRIVEAQDLSTESGRAMYAALISVSGAFAGLTPVLDSVAATVSTTVDALQVAMARAQNANAMADSAMAALTASIDAEKSSLSSKYESDLSKLTAAQDAYTQSVTASISSISASVGSLQSLSNRLKSSLSASLAGTDGQQRQSAQALIASVLAIAKSGGGLPKDTTALESALSTVTKPSQALFGSFEDYARDFYKTSTDIAALSDITDTTLTAQQQMLAQLEAQSAISKAAYSSQAKLLKDQYDQAVKGLDTTLASAQKQLDALHGIDTSVLSVSAAIDRLGAALGAAKTTQTTSNAVTDDTIRGYIANLKTGGGTEADMVITLAKRAKEVGVTQADIARAMSMTEADVASYFASFGIPKFAVGTNYVPNDMIAQIHEGEAIIPKAYNPAANNGNGETAAALRALADRLDRIEANTRATAGHTAGTDRKLARVIPGNALITEAAV